MTAEGIIQLYKESNLKGTIIINNSMYTMDWFFRHFTGDKKELWNQFYQDVILDRMKNPENSRRMIFTQEKQASRSL